MFTIVDKKDIPIAILKFQELLCGCGTPGVCWQWLLTYLEKLETKNINQFNCKIPSEWLAVYIICTQCKMTTHGCSIIFSWLTNEGVTSLHWLREKGVDYADDMVINYS